MTRTLLFRAVLLMTLTASGAVAQRNPDAGQRDSLEERVRSRMAQVMRTQLGLSDDQVRRLQTVNRRFEGQRRDLFEQERRVRIELRAAIDLGDSTQNARIGPLLDRTIQLQRQRLDLQEAEQKELSTFLTPLQRARIYGFEEQMRRRVQEMREAGGAPDAGAGPRRPVGGGRPGGLPPQPGARRPPTR